MRNIIILMTVAALCGCTKAGGDASSTDIPSPSALVLEQTNTTTIKLSWTAPSGDYDGILVEKAGEDKVYSELGTVAKGVTGYTDRSMSVDGTYWYRIASYSGSGRSEWVEASILYSKLPPPTELKAEKLASGVKLTWKDNCTGETSYVVRRTPDGSSTYDKEEILAADVTSWTDASVSKGKFTYQVMAKKELDFSAPAVVVYENYSLPVVSIGDLNTSWFTVSAPITLSDDGGDKCEVGVCWVEGNGTPTVDGYHAAYPVKVSKGEYCFGNATNRDLDYGKTYTFRVYASNGAGISYSASVRTGSLAAEPAAITPEWTEVTSSYSMPSSIKIYSTTSSVDGHSFKAWYAIADMSKGDLEFRAIHNDTGLAFPSSMITNNAVSGAYVIINGGYFDTGSNNASFSYVYDRGVHKANQVSSLSRVNTYSVTRGAMGVNVSQQPSIKWIATNKSRAYDVPLPVYNGGPGLTPTASFPEQSEDWDIYSAIGGAPVLLKDGKICFDHMLTSAGRYMNNFELLQDDIFGPMTSGSYASNRPQRTAVGYTADGKIVLMVTDGRNVAGTPGLSLYELARLMKGVGCVGALNLDGGGSTTMCAVQNGTSKTIYGNTRKVRSFVAITKK